MNTTSGKTLSHALGHHARSLNEMVGVLSTGILTRLVPLGWQLEPVLSGANSYKLHRNGVEFHFRARGPRRAMVIDVMDGYVHGRRVARLATRVDVLRFIDARVAEG